MGACTSRPRAGGPRSACGGALVNRGPGQRSPMYSCESSFFGVKAPAQGTPNDRGSRRPSWPQPLTGNCPELPPTRCKSKSLPSATKSSQAGKGSKLQNKRAALACQTPSSSSNESTYFFVFVAANYCCWQLLPPGTSFRGQAGEPVPRTIQRQHDFIPPPAAKRGKVWGGVCRLVGR